MLRFILKRKYFDCHNDYNSCHYETLSVDVPELENKLTNGGYGPQGYDVTELIGVSVESKKITAPEEN